LTTDLYSFTGTAGQQLDIRSLGDSVAYGAYYRLYQPDLGEVSEAYTDTNYGDTQITLTQSGTYVLAVEGQSAANPSVTYSLAAYLSTPTSSPLTLNTVTSGNITSPFGKNIYTFNGTVGQHLLFDGLVAAGNFTFTLFQPAQRIRRCLES